MITDQELVQMAVRHSRALPENSRERWDDTARLLEEVKTLRFLVKKGAYVTANVRADLAFLLNTSELPPEALIHLMGNQGLLEDWYARFKDYDPEEQF